MVKQILSATKQRTRELHLQFREQTAAAIIAAFGFLIALAWKDVITQAVSYLTPKQNLLLSALVISLISVIGISIVTRWATKGKENNSLKSS